LRTERNRTKAQAYLVCLALLAAMAVPAAAQGPSVLKVQIKDFADYSRVIIETAQPLAFNFERSGAVLKVKMDSPRTLRLQGEPVTSQAIKSLSWAKQGITYILSIEVKVRDFSYNFFTLNKPFQLMIDIRPEAPLPGRAEKTAPAPIVTPAPVEPVIFERTPPAGPKGLRTIVIDPGHGGLESGARGRFGTLEKEVTLGIALKLKALIERNLALRVVLTRDKDIEVGLENRAALANNNAAMLFISIHANGSYRKNSNGSEVYFLNLNAVDEETRRLAYLENNTGELEQKMDQQDANDLRMILWDMAQSSFIKQSGQLAEFIQVELNTLLGTANRGIKQAPFKVLTEVACPAVLVETAFISNPEEERKLSNAEFQGHVAQAIYSGLVNYIKLYSQE
jgi:N-acetylmuramoyl-L-alanine amidase